MTMKKSLAISAVIHGVIVAILFYTINYSQIYPPKKTAAIELAMDNSNIENNVKNISAKQKQITAGDKTAKTSATKKQLIKHDNKVSADNIEYMSASDMAGKLKNSTQPGKNMTPNKTDGGLQSGTDNAGNGIEAGKSRRAALMPPQLIYAVKPEYPAELRKEAVEGTVVLQIIIGTDGRVKSTEILSSSGYARLDEAAVKSMHDYKFTPAKYADGSAFAARVKWPVKFKLN